MEERLIIYKIVNPITREPIYIGVTSSLEAARRNLYWASNHKLSAEITSIRAAGMSPVIEVLEEPHYTEIKQRAFYWRATYREMGFPLHNAPDKGMKRSARRRKLPTGTIEIELPEALLYNKTFKKMVAGGMLSARIAELLMAKVEEIERDNAWLNS